MIITVINIIKPAHFFDQINNNDIYLMITTVTIRINGYLVIMVMSTIMLIGT